MYSYSTVVVDSDIEPEHDTYASSVFAVRIIIIVVIININIISIIIASDISREKKKSSGTLSSCFSLV